MKFKLTTAESFYTDKEKEKYSEFNFDFKEVANPYPREAKWYINPDEKEYFIEINSLEELIEFVNKYGRIIIDEVGGYEIRIYDGYNE